CSSPSAPARLHAARPGTPANNRRAAIFAFMTGESALERVRSLAFDERVQVLLRVRVVRSKFQRPPEMRNGLIGLASGSERDAEIVVHLRVVGPDRQGLLDVSD